MIWRILAFGLLSIMPVQATELRVATWNLGWHLSAAEAADWIKGCGAPFAQDAATGIFAPRPDEACH